MGYVNQIGGNYISDDKARKDIYNLANAVEAIIEALQYSDIKSDYYTVTNAFIDLTNCKSFSEQPTFNNDFSKSIKKIKEISKYSGDENKKNIL